MWSAAKAAAEAADTAVGEEFTEECGEGRQRRWRRRHRDYGQRRRWLGSKVRAWEAVRRAAGILFQVTAAKRWQQGWRPRVLLRLRGRTPLCKTSPQSTRTGRERRRRRRRQHKRKRRRIRQGLGGRGDGAAGARRRRRRRPQRRCSGRRQRWRQKRRGRARRAVEAQHVSELAQELEAQDRTRDQRERVDQRRWCERCRSGRRLWTSST